ncbi:hypothetical protein GCM10009839_82110 [Catenulispora yoronensis]|uniref:Integral membrane protein n=2 Tax=Catenulispora yoronensis TaxID=450799 RepID=A0ABN2VD38_9ACTN
MPVTADAAATAAVQTPPLREARAAVFAALCVLVGALGHDAFSRSSIPLWAVFVGGLAVFLLAQLFTRRECGLPTILVLMGIVQFGLHHLFGFAQQLAADATPMAMAMPARGYWWCGHDEPSGVAQAMAHVAGMPPSQHSMTVGMWAAHAGAALAAAWWLRRGEAAVWSLGRALALALITPLVLLAAALVPGCWTPPRRPAATAVAGPDRLLGPGRLLRFDLARRGPPMTAAAAV